MAPLFINLDKYKHDFSDLILGITGLQPKIDGDIHVSFFPTPSLRIDNISIANPDGATSASLLYSDGLEAEFTFTSLFKSKFDPKSITLIRPRLEVEKMENGKYNFQKLFESSNNNQGIEIPLNIQIKSGAVVYRTDSTKITFDYINADIDIASKSGPFNFKGDFLQGVTTVNFLGKIGNLNENAEASFKLSSDSFEFNMKGNYRPGDNFDIHGSSDLNISNLGSFADSFLQEIPFVAEIKSNEKLKANSNFLVSKEITSFSKISLESESVKGNGNVDLLYEQGKDNFQWDTSLNVQKIDIDKLLAHDKNNIKTQAKYSSILGLLAAYKFEIPVSLSALFSFSVDEITYNNDKVQNVSIDTDISNGKAIIHSLSAILPGNSKIEFAGNIDHNGIRPILTGRLKAYGDNLRTIINWLSSYYNFIPENELQEFLFSCDVNVTPRKMMISNIYASVDKSLVNGSLFIRPSNNFSAIKIDLDVDRMDLDKYNITKQIDNFINQTVSEIKNINLDTSWLKLFNYKLSLSFKGSDITYNSNNISDMSFIMGVTKGVMSVQNIYVNSDLTNLYGKFNVDLNQEIPNLNLDLYSKYSYKSLVERAF